MPGERYYTAPTMQPGRTMEQFYRPEYMQHINGEQLVGSVIALCVMYFIARLFFNGLMLVLFVGITVTIIMQILDGITANVKPMPRSRS